MLTYKSLLLSKTFPLQGHSLSYTNIQGVLSVMVTVIGNGHSDHSSNPGQDSSYFLHSVKTLGKDMNPIILSPSMGK